MVEVWIYIQVNDVGVAAFEPNIGSPIVRDPIDDRTVDIRVTATATVADTNPVYDSVVNREVQSDGNDFRVRALLLAQHRPL